MRKQQLPSLEIGIKCFLLLPFLEQGIPIHWFTKFTRIDHKWEWPCRASRWLFILEHGPYVLALRLFNRFRIKMCGNS